MRLFVTGAGGFVGSNFCHRFREHDIVRFDRASCPDDADCYLHFAGKAHDVHDTSSAEEYFEVNTELTKRVFDSFLASRATTFIFLSSVKAAADHFEGILDESIETSPTTAYGKSKLLAEQYVLARPTAVEKRAYVLRPCMIHGPGNKGNLNLLYDLVSKGFPWPLGSFGNQRSFLSMDNLLFVLEELMVRQDIEPGIYNVSDSQPLSTNDLVRLIARSRGMKVSLLRVPKFIISSMARFGDLLGGPLNSERLSKLTENFVVSNEKVVRALGKPLPLTSEEGLSLTFRSFSSDVK